VDYLSGLFLGALQGLLEWLPVSSSGQSMLVLLGLFGLSAQAAFTYGIFFHLGTLFAVLLKYRIDWLKILDNPPLTRFLAVTTAFTAASGLFAYYLLKRSMSTFSGEALNGFVGLLLVVTGLILYHMRRRDFGTKDVSALSLSESAVVGLTQGFSVLPGISRSGATVAALALSDVRQDEALRLSFLMSVPAVAGAVAVEIAPRMRA